jgi:hypothetical protein
MLAPSAGETPSGVEISVVTGPHVFPAVPSVVTHVERSKISLAPVWPGAFTRFVAEDEKETNNPDVPITGCELGPLPGVNPLAPTETIYVVGVQVPVGTEGGTIVQVSRR